MSALIKATCTKCGSQFSFMNQELDLARMKCCDRCHVRLTVTSTEDLDDPSKRTAATWERCPITDRTTAIARGLVLSALGE